MIYPKSGLIFTLAITQNQNAPYWPSFSLSYSSSILLNNPLHIGFFLAGHEWLGFAKNIGFTPSYQNYLTWYRRCKVVKILRQRFRWVQGNSSLKNTRSSTCTCVPTLTHTDAYIRTPIRKQAHNYNDTYAIVNPIYC